MIGLYVVIVIVVIMGVYHWTMLPSESMAPSPDHAVHCNNRQYAGGPGYRAICSRGHAIPTTYHVDTAWNSDVSTSRNMNYSYSYWNGIKLASCDECPTPYVCKQCPKFTGAGDGFFDDPNKIRGINDEIEVGADEKAPSAHGEFFGASPVFGTSADSAPLVPLRPVIDDITPLASNAYEIARRMQENRNRPVRGNESIKADNMVGIPMGYSRQSLLSPAPMSFTVARENIVGDSVGIPMGRRQSLLSPAPMQFTVARPVPYTVSPPPMGFEPMSISGHNEVYHGHHGEFIGEDMCSGMPYGTPSGTSMGDPEDMYYRYRMDYAADSVSEISRELHAAGVAKPRVANREMYVDGSEPGVIGADGAALALRKHASTAGCRRATASNAAQLLYTGVLGLHNPLPDTGQCEYLRSNGYVYQEPCALGAA